MNWRKVFLNIHSILTIVAAAIGAGGFWAFVISGLCRMIFGLSDDNSIFFIAIPLFLIFTILGIIYFRKPLRKAGWIV